MADLGSYQCVAGFNGSYQFSNLVTVVNAFTEVFYENPRSQDIISGSNVTLSCISGLSAPPASITWFKNDVLYEGGEQSIENFGIEKEGGAMRRKANLIFISTYDAGGNYHCIATNLLSMKLVLSASAFLHNTILPVIPSLIKSLPEVVIVAEGNSIYLDCQMTGWPPPTLYWQINKTRTSNNSRWTSWPNGTLLLRSVIRSESHGSYVCTGQNSQGVISPKGVIVIISYLDAIFRKNPSSKVAQYGGKTSLSCSSPQSNPEANISWFKEGKLLEDRSSLTNQKYIISIINNISLLQIDQVLYTDSGFYVCHASNVFASNELRISNVAELIVEGIPEIFQPPMSKNVVLKDILWLECKVRANPQSSISWYKNSQLIIESLKISTSQSNQFLTLLNFNQEDVGRYSCRAENLYGTVYSSEAIVSLIVPPVISTSIENTTVHQNRSAFVPCKFYSQPPNLTYWFKDDFPIGDKLGKYSIQKSGLFINKTIWEDSGFYKCCSMNKAGILCQSAHLDVQLLPIIGNISNDLTTNSSENVKIFCSVCGNPNPRVTWLHNGDVLNMEFSLETHGNYSILKIFNSTVVYSGKYTCIGTNVVGSSSESVLLFVREKPKISPLQGSLEIINGQNLILNCSILSGNPFPVVTWLKNNSIVEPTQDLRIVFAGNWSILLKFVTIYDGGRYTCVARNEIGEDSSSVVVTVAVPPGIPVNIIIVSVSMSTINVSWSVPMETPNSRVDYYVIQIKREYMNTFETRADNINKTHMWFQVTNLSPGTRHWLRVAGSNRAGVGLFTSPVEGTTAFSDPSEPRNLNIFQVSARWAVVSWEIPLHQNSAITRYILQFRPKYPLGLEYTSIETAPISGPQQQLNITNLESLTTYECRVRAASIVNKENLLSAFSIVYLFTTLLSVPIRCPINLEIYLNSSSFILLTWDASEDRTGNDPISGFKVEHELLTSHERSSVVVEYKMIKMNSYLNHLKPWSDYLIKLSPFNDAGDGGCRVERIIKTPPIAPTGSPLNVQVQIVEDDSILVTWQEVPPIDRTCDISTYYISCASSTDGKDFQVNTKTLLIRDLSGGNEYFVKVRAFCYQVGFGPFTEPAKIFVPGRASTLIARITTKRLQTITQTTFKLYNNISTPTTSFTEYDTMKISISTLHHQISQSISFTIIGVCASGGILIIFLLFGLCYSCYRSKKTNSNELFYVHPYAEQHFWQLPNREKPHQENDWNIPSFWNI